MTHSESPPAETGEASAKPEPFTSYSLNFEDVILKRLFPERREGFYVDVGAGHPRFENDLYAFYLRGWSGINVEPNEGFFALQQKLRPRDHNLCMVLSNAEGDDLTYFEVEGSGLSTCDEVQAKLHASQGHVFRVRSVPVGTLAGILSDAGVRQIDILKVDVEGFEEKVLGGNDWERFRPSVVVVEATYPESRRRRPTNILGFMEQRGYRHVHFDGLNDFYLEHEFAEPEGLRLSPNVFDGFVLREVADLREQVGSLRASFTSAEAYAHSLETSAEGLKDQLAASQAALASLQTSFASLQTSHGKAVAAAEQIAAENRRLGLQIRSLTNDSRRWRSATEQLRAEVTMLNGMLEPLHTLHEQVERRRDSEHALETTRAELQQRMGDMQLDRDRRERDLIAMHERLAAVYASRSWLLTKPWRALGRILKRS